MIRAVIIEDEPNSRELLKNMVSNYCEHVEIVGEADDVPSGVAVINELKPSLVFLDIEMPGGDGFDVINQISNLDFAVIFVTGYNQYAIKAIKYAALDYLLKPIGLGELRAAIQKVQTMGPTPRRNIQFLQDNIDEKEEDISQIVIPGKQEHSVIEIDDILYLEAQGNYVRFHLDDGLNRLVSYPLNFYEQLLPKSIFFRIHKSHIINLAQVERYEGGRTGKVHLKNGHGLDIAARRKSAFIQLISQLRLRRAHD